jgi:peptidoglycan glycosyltransferase
VNPRIRWVGIILVICFGLLFLQLNNIQVRQASALSKNPLASSGQVSSIYLPRGVILSADHKILAYSKKTSLGWQRVYPQATARDFGQVTGFFPTAIRRGPPAYGIEAQYYSYLAQHESPINSLNSVLTQHEETDNVILTIPSKLQAEAASLINGKKGAAIVALDPRNGDVLAMDGFPSYNPNPVSSLDFKVANRAWNQLNKSYPDPYVNLASDLGYAPGSTFKPMDTAAIFQYKPGIAAINWPFRPYIKLPDTNALFHNYASESCGGSLAEVLAVSCDTAYAQIGLRLGAKDVVREAEAFGWCQESKKRIPGICATGGTPPPLDLPSSEVVGATLAPLAMLQANPPFLAYSSIGQFDDSTSALSMALVAAGIADNGKIMAPHLMSEIVDSDGNVVRRYHPHLWKQATTAAIARKVRQLMIGPTEGSPWPGTAAGVFSNLQSQGVQVAAKTGTAEAVISSTTKNCATYDWMIAMAPINNGQIPKAVVAVVVPTPNGANACAEATGAGIAGPVIDKMLTDLLQAGY